MVFVTLFINYQSEYKPPRSIMGTFGKITFILICLLFTVTTLSAQQGKVQGKVTAFDEIAIRNAEITVKKTKEKVFTDSMGIFRIACKLKDKLTIKAAGLKRRHLRLRI